MAYLPAAVPLPRPTADDEPFWTNCRQRRLTFQRCAACGELTHPPLAVCPACQSFTRTWIEAPAAARVFTFTWIHTAAHDSIVGAALPYNVAVVDFPDLPGVRLVTNITDVRLGELAVGDRVTLVWEDAGEGWFLPRFRKHIR